MPDSDLQERVVNFLDGDGGSVPERGGPVAEEDPSVQRYEFVKSAPGQGPIVRDGSPAGDDDTEPDEEPIEAEEQSEDEPEVEVPEEGAEETEEAEPEAEEEEESEPEDEASEEPEISGDEFDLPEEGTFYFKADGKVVSATGAALANAFRREKDIQKRFEELKTQREAVERAEQGVSQRSQRLAAELLARAGYLRPDGSLLPPPQNAPSSQPTGEAEAEQTEKQRLELAKFNLEEIDEDDLLGRGFYEKQNAQAESIEKALSTILEKVEGLRSQPPAGQQGQVGAAGATSQADAVREWETNVRNLMSQHTVFASDPERVEQGIDDVISLIHDRGFSGPIEDAVTRVARVHAAETGVVGPAASHDAKVAAPAGSGEGRKAPPKRKQPPAAGTGGRRPPTRKPAGREQQGIGLGTMQSRERLLKELRSRGIE